MRSPPRLAFHAHAIRAAAANGDLRRVQIARLTSVTGRWAYTVTLAVFAYRTSGAAGVAVAGIIRLGPATLVAPFTGALAARFRVDRLLLVGGAVRTAALAAAARPGGRREAGVAGVSVRRCRIGVLDRVTAVTELAPSRAGADA